MTKSAFRPEWDKRGLEWLEEREPELFWYPDRGCSWAWVDDEWIKVVHYGTETNNDSEEDQT